MNVFVNHLKLNQKGKLIEEQQYQKHISKSTIKKDNNYSDISESDYGEEDTVDVNDDEDTDTNNNKNEESEEEDI